MVRKASSNAKSSTDKEVTNTVTNSKRSRAVAVAQSEDDESDDVVEEKPVESKKKRSKSKMRGRRGSKKQKKQTEEDIAERAAFILDKSLEEQSLMYELIEAKKKEQAQKVKVNKYYIKYGKHY